MSAVVRRATRHHRCARCGFEQTYENAGATQARYWFNKHSCRKYEELGLRAFVAAEREAKIDRTPKPCHHKIANHQHGTRACYVLDKCRCKPCSKANAEAETWRERQKAYGRYTKYVNAMPVREHVQALRDAGMGTKTIAKRSGVAHGALWKLIYGKKRPDGSQTPSRRVLRTTAEKLYALDPDWTDQPLKLAGGALVDGTGTRTRLRALVALGYSMNSLGQLLDIQNIHNLVHGTANGCPGNAQVMVSTEKAVAELFERICMTLPRQNDQRSRIATSRARNYAKARGWLPPLALDDLAPYADIDPSDELDESAIDRRMHGDKTVRLAKAEAAELVRRWRATGRPLNECQYVTGINPHRHITLDQEGVA